MSEFRKRLLDPILPLFVIVAFVGLMVFSVSRILLAVPAEGSTVIALVLAAEILFVAAVVAAARRLKAIQRSVIGFLAVALVGGGIASGATFGVRPVEKHVSGIPVTAKALAFVEKEIFLKADQENAIAFSNDDAGIPHNVVVTRDEKLTDRIFTGEIVNGVTEVTYTVPALPAGDYFFFCEVHPFMKGEAVSTANPPAAGEHG